MEQPWILSLAAPGYRPYREIAQAAKTCRNAMIPRRGWFERPAHLISPIAVEQDFHADVTPEVVCAAPRAGIRNFSEMIDAAEKTAPPVMEMPAPGNYEWFSSSCV
jgi:hypothetical protein